MNSLEAMDSRLTFEHILDAVQDSKRGRWFLKEFEQRLQKQDTTSILQAISKLEARMDGFGAQTGDAGELGRVKAAIANARNDLLKMGVGKDALSAEGQMFASLAEMARKALPVSGEENAGVVRTLQLVAEIENSIAGAPAINGASKFFGADENLFERAPAAPKPMLIAPVAVEAVQATPAPAIVEQAKPAAVVQTAPKPIAPQKEEPVATGAKLIIRRTSANTQSTEAPAAEPAAPPVIEQAAAPVTAVVEPSSVVQMVQPKAEVVATPEAPVIDSPRIVIIRRKAEDMADMQATSAA